MITIEKKVELSLLSLSKNMSALEENSIRMNDLDS